MGVMESLARMMGAQQQAVLVEGAGSYVDAVDADEDLWSPIKGGRRRDLNPIEQKRSRKISLYLWRRNPVAHRLIEQMADFVVGDGFTITADTDQAQRIADEIWNDPVIELALRHRDIVRDLSLFGELAVKTAVNPKLGRMRLGFLDVERVKDLDLDPDNVLVDKTLWVYQEDVTAGYSVEGIPIPLYVWDDMSSPGEGKWVGEGFYHGVNRILGQQRGTPDLLAIADYVDGYDQLVFNALERSGLVNAFLYDVTLKGFDESKIADWVGRHGTAPRPGSVRAHNESETWDVLTPNLGSSDTVALGREVKNMGLGGAGVPEAWFAQGDSVNRATLVAQGDPTYRMLKCRQDFVQAMFKRWIEVGLQHAQGKRLTTASRPQVQVNVPDISQKDLTGVSAALPQVANALVNAIGNEMIDKKSSRRIFLAVAGQLGVKLDEDEVEKAIEAEKEERAAEQETQDVEQALRMAAGLTPQGFPPPKGPALPPSGGGPDQPPFPRRVGEGLAEALIPRMKCAGKNHHRKVEIPPGFRPNGNGDRIVAAKYDKMVMLNGRWAEPGILCDAPGPCWRNPDLAAVRAPMVPVYVKGRTNAGVACSPRCTGATGDDCECECGGGNHGALAEAEDEDHFYGAWTGPRDAKGHPEKGKGGDAHLTAPQRKAVQGFEATVAAEETTRNPNPGHGQSYGNERGMAVDADGKVLWVGSGEPNKISGGEAHFRPGVVFTHFHPDEASVAHLSDGDVSVALATGATIRAFNANGAWQQFTPFGAGGHLGISLQDIYPLMKAEQAKTPGLGSQDAYTVVLKSLSGRRGTWDEGGHLAEAKSGWGITHSYGNIKNWENAQWKGQEAREKADEEKDHYYGAWSGGSKSAGGHPKGASPVDKKDAKGVSSEGLAVAARNGGFSVTIQGQAPEGGYMVSPYHEFEERFPAASLKAADLADYAADHLDVLSRPNHYFGAWQDSTPLDSALESEIVLDISVRCETLAEAGKLAREHGQEAIFDVAKGTAVDTADIAEARKRRLVILGPNPTAADCEAAVRFLKGEDTDAAD